MPLSDRDRALLAFEAQWPLGGAAKDEAVRAQLGMPPARYYQLLGRLIDTAAALEHEPMLVRRLRRLRENREAVRAARVTRTGTR